MNSKIIPAPWCGSGLRWFQITKWVMHIFHLVLYGMRKKDRNLLIEAISQAAGFRLSVVDILALNEGAGFSEGETPAHVADRYVSRCTVYVIPIRGVRFTLDLGPRISTPQRICIACFPEMEKLAQKMRAVTCRWITRRRKEILGPHAPRLMVEEIKMVLIPPGSDAWAPIDLLADVNLPSNEP